MKICLFVRFFLAMNQKKGAQIDLIIPYIFIENRLDLDWCLIEAEPKTKTSWSSEPRWADLFFLHAKKNKKRTAPTEKAEARWKGVFSF